MDVTPSRVTRRVAGGVDRNALLPAQNKEDVILGAVLEYRSWVAGHVMDVSAWRSKRSYLVIIGRFCYDCLRNVPPTPRFVFRYS